MRKGRGHDDRTKHNNQIDHRRGGGGLLNLRTNVVFDAKVTYHL